MKNLIVLCVLFVSCSLSLAQSYYGSCCYSNGQPCEENVPESWCDSPYGYWTEGGSCNSDCPEGACCYASGCQDGPGVNERYCNSIGGGQFFRNGHCESECAEGACCNRERGTCVDNVNFISCQGLGTFLGPETCCYEDCYNGICCYNNGCACEDYITEADCDMLGGEFIPGGSCDWDCPAYDPTSFIAWDSDQANVGELTACIKLCHSGEPHTLNIGPFPHYCQELYDYGFLSVLPGCDFGLPHCNSDCPPADTTDVIYDGLDWTWVDIGGDIYIQTHLGLTPGGQEGCVCVKLECKGSGCHPDCWLPVELLSFTAFPENKGIRIEFTTATEADNDHFEIWKGNSESGDFAQIARIESQGESASEQHYSYLDEHVTAGCTYWYYLADVDINGNRN